MSTTNIKSTAQDVLNSFELLPEPEKQEVAAEILRRKYAFPSQINEAQLAALYAECADADRKLAEEGIEEYGKGLVSEDTE